MRLGDGEIGVGAGVPGTDPLAIPDMLIFAVRNRLADSMYLIMCL
jgi:hypothetical protein